MPLMFLRIRTQWRYELYTITAIYWPILYLQQKQAGDHVTYPRCSLTLSLL